MTDKDTPIDTDQMMTLEDIATVEKVLIEALGPDTAEDVTHLCDSARAGLYERDCREINRAYYAQRDQRQREALETVKVFVADQNIWHAVTNHPDPDQKSLGDVVAAALTSHPADTDASKFVEKVTNEKIAKLERDIEHIQGENFLVHEAAQTHFKRISELEALAVAVLASIEVNMAYTTLPQAVRDATHALDKALSRSAPQPTHGPQS